MKRWGLVVLVFSLVSLMALADGGERKATPEENAFFEHVHTSVMALMPQALSGATQNPQAYSPPFSLGLGAEKHPLAVNVVCQYDKTMSGAAVMDISKDAGAMEEMSARMSKVTEQMQAAAGKGDQKEMQRLQEEMQAIVSGNPAMQKMQAQVGDAKKDSAIISVFVNAHGADYDRVKEIPAPAPAMVALRHDTTTDGQNNSSSLGLTTVFIGPYKKTVEGQTIKVYATDDNGPGARIHRMIIQIDADPKLADAYLASMDLKKLAALIP